MFGCANGTSVDKDEQASIKECLADLLDAMQDVEDEIEVIHLHNCKPFYCKEHTNKYAKALQDVIQAKQFQWEDVTIQVKCILRGKRTAAHADDLKQVKWAPKDVHSLFHIERCIWFCVIHKNSHQQWDKGLHPV
jgi:hypothetical protein